MKKKNKICLAVLLAALLLTGCGSNSTATNEVTKNIYAMDTYMTVTVYDYDQDAAESAVEEAAKIIENLEKEFSAEDENSEVYKLNETGLATLSEDSSALLAEALKLWDETDKNFDVAIYPVMELWGFCGDRSNLHVPDETSLMNALALANPDNISFDQTTGETKLLQEGMAIDFGGIAKGYTSQKLIDYFTEQGFESAIVSLGGNVQVLGSKPDGSDWNVAIQDPDDSSSYLGAIKVNDGTAVITSGGYERYFEEDGVTYHHIIDPATGYPANNGLKSVTIVSKDATLADGLSTSIYIMGLEKGISYWQKNGQSQGFDMILLDDEGGLYVTEGIAESFTTVGDYTAQVIDSETGL